MTKYLTCFLFSTCLGSCLIDEKCLDPDCHNASSMRFNLVDTSGTDLVFDSAVYNISEIKVIDLAGKEQPIKTAAFGGPQALVVNLVDHKNEYQLLLKGTAVDTFKVSYKKTNEECCGETFWIEDVVFDLHTGIKDPNIGSIPIILE